MSIDIERASAIVRVAVDAVQLLEAAVQKASAALGAGRAQLGDVQKQLDAALGKVAADDAKHDHALDEKFK